MYKFISIFLEIFLSLFCLQEKPAVAINCFDKRILNDSSNLYKKDFEIENNNFYKNDSSTAPTKSIDYEDNSTLIPNYFYFTNLNGYHGLNDNGCCMIISAQIMLGYYDTFLNDSLVDDLYDVDGYTYSSSTALNQFVQSPGTGNRTDDQRFRDYLIDLSNAVNGSGSLVNGLSNQQQKNFIEVYLNNSNLSYSLSYCLGTIDQDWSGEAKTLIKNTINSGRPVIANSVSHSYVAFGYSDNYVYVHTGWGYCESVEWSIFESPFPLIRSIGALDIEFSCNHSHSDNYHSFYHNKYYCPCGFSYDETVLAPEDYGFQSQYYFYHSWKEISKNGYTFDTHRLRTGYIEESFINLSPRREGAGTAYLEFYLPDNIRKIIMHISFWGQFEYYNVNNQNHSARIQYADEYSIFYNTFDLLRDINLSSDRENQNLLCVNFPYGTTAFRFMATHDAIGNSNRGRISIGTMSIVHE